MREKILIIEDYNYEETKTMNEQQKQYPKFAKWHGVDREKIQMKNNIF